MNEWEAAMLDMVREQNEALKRIEAAAVHNAAECAGIRQTLADMAKRPNVIHLLRRVQGVEGEVSEIRGVVVRHDAELGRLAAGRGDAK